MLIKKIEVARGIYWLEIEAIGLRILCGSPADAVKHLMKRGLIVSVEVGGVRCESGPNAILLSDVSVQNGEFSNLAEFPVLQMLYRQGMLVPGHPNNTGQKPMLIGSSDQVQSQLNYIYRGNYGLINATEIMQSGVAEPLAEEMMRIKRKFAFGSIRSTSDFLDTRCVEGEAVEIYQGAFVSRVDSNVFQLIFRGETMMVDLNLKQRDGYECAYPLGFHRLDLEYFSVIHSGEGDGWDVNRPSMSSILIYQGSIYLIDAGPQVTHILTALGIGVDQVDGIFHTHAHDDHFAGLTALMRSGRRIKYFATPLVRHSVSKKLAALIGVEGQFSELFEICDLSFDTWNNISGLEVMPIYSPHPVDTNIYVFRALWEDGYRTYAHWADIASFKVLEAMRAKLPGDIGISPEMLEQTRRAYLAPYDLKKIDIGGGMIHGDALDFVADKSQRIILAHRATELSTAEKEIGSNASFGTVDVLIRGVSDGFRRKAYTYLEANLPGVSNHDMRILINHSVSDINPGSIFLKEGELSDHVWLLVSGRVEKINSSQSLLSLISGGSLIGDDTLFDDVPSGHTYRAASFVRVLKLPKRLYVAVIARNQLEARVRKIAEMRNFLSLTSLFNEALPLSLLSKLIVGAKEFSISEDTVVSGMDIDELHIIRSGAMQLSYASGLVDTLTEHDFFGEESTVLNIPGMYSARALKDTEGLRIPGDLISDVPILRWRVFEGFQQRTARQ